MTLADLVHPARAHRYARYRELMPGIGVVCPAERLQTDGTAQWARRHGLTVAAYTSSQLALAISLGIAPSRLIVFGDRAQWSPIRCATNANVRQFVVDSCEQVAILEHCADRGQQVLLDMRTESLDDAIAAICASDRLHLVGLHWQVDTRSRGAHAYAVPVDVMVGQMDRIHRHRGVIPTRLSLAGPVWDSPQTVAAVIESAVEGSCARHHFPRPSLAFTPDAG